MTVIIGLALAANALLLALALSIGRQLINELAGTVFGPASSVPWPTRCWPISSAAGRCCGSGCSWWSWGGSPGPTPPVALSARHCPAAWSRSGHSWPTVALAVPVGGSRQTPGGPGRGMAGVVVLLWGNDVSVSRLGWSLPSRSCSWRSCRSWSGPAAEPIVVRAPDSRPHTLHDRRQTQGRQPAPAVAPPRARRRGGIEAGPGRPARRPARALARPGVGEACLVGAQPTRPARRR